MGIQIEVRNLKVVSLDVDLLELSWTLADTRADVLDYTFQVLRSESPEGPFDSITSPFEDRYLFLDRNIHTGHKWRQFFYKLRVTRKNNGEQLDTEAVQLAAPPDLVARELRRHWQLLYQEFAGRQTWLLPIRTFGQRCSCWSETLKMKTRSGCRTCFDTGYVRGYMAPIQIAMQIDPAGKSEQQDPTPRQSVDTMAHVGFYPPIKPRDVIIEAENKRWRVDRLSMAEKGRAVTRQHIVLHEIEPTDVEYSIPLELSLALRDLWSSPPRNFSNPSSLEGLEQDTFESVFGLYGATSK